MYPKLGVLKFRDITKGYKRFGTIASAAWVVAHVSAWEGKVCRKAARCCHSLAKPKIAFVLLCLLLLPLLAAAQNKKDLEEKRRKIIRDIETTERMLQKTAKNKEATYDRFLALQSQIESRESLIQTLSEEIGASEEIILRNRQVANFLNEDIKRMQEEYGQTLRAAYRRKSMGNPLLYILSAESLNQAFRRWLFLKKYDKFRQQQANAIAFTRDMLTRRSKELEDTRIEKENLLVSMSGQQEALSTESLTKNELLKELEQDEARLKEDLNKKQQEFAALNAAIESVIASEEIKREREAKRKKEAAPPAPKPEKKAENATPPAEKTSPPKPEIKSTPKPPPASDKPAAQPALPSSKPEVKAPEKKTETDAEPEMKAAPEVEEDVFSQEFRQTKGRLPWPVESGFIAKRFGTQKHPTLRNIEITNNGIDIRTDENALIYAVFGGEVAGIQSIPGHDYTIIIRHGDYYTVYANLGEVQLSKGDQVKARQAIGRVSTNPITSASELHFELWRQKERLNPSLWIKK